MCATGARLCPILASFEHPSQDTSGFSNVTGRRNCAQTTHGCCCARRRLGGMMLLIGSLAIDLKPCYLPQPLLLPCLAVKVPRLTGVSGLEIWIVTVPALSNVSEATDAPNAA